MNLIPKVLTRVVTNNNKTTLTMEAGVTAVIIIAPAVVMAGVCLAEVGVVGSTVVVVLATAASTGRTPAKPQTTHHLTNNNKLLIKVAETRMERGEPTRFFNPDFTYITNILTKLF